MQRFMALTDAEKKKRIELQSHMEIQMEEYSTAKYWKGYDDSPMSGRPEQELINEFIKQVGDAYQAWLDYWKDMKNKHNQSSVSDWKLPLFVLDGNHLAAIVISQIVELLLNHEIFGADANQHAGDIKFTYQKAAKKIGEQVKKICEYRITKENFIEDWKKQSHYLKNWEPKRCDAFTKRFMEIPKWKAKQYGELGHHLLHIASQADCINIETRKVRAGKGWKQETILGLNQELLDTLKTMHNAHQFLRIIYRPMIIPPVDHTLEIPGGVLDINLRKPTVAGGSKPTQQDLDALNAMQRTEWTINSEVLDVMETMFRNNWEFCNLPPKDLDKVSFPARVPDDASKEEKAKAIAERAEIWAEWYKSEQKRLQMQARISMARELETLGYFYHVYTMDFRGRAYSTCTMLSPQSGDFDRGLIKFATPVTQTPEGRYWQAVALANAMDGADGWDGVASDKSTFDERVAWVVRNREQLLWVAENPLEGAHLWADNVTKKKNPSFQRLASILDFHETQTKGTTSYPVQLDGACNGSQHWSAIMRDPKIAELTNVTPVEKPQDLYQYVADIADEEMKRRAADNNLWCQRFVEHWGNLSRKVVKRATMCDAYGITPHGIRKYAREEGHLDWVKEQYGPEVMAAAVSELASLEMHGLDGAMEASNMGKEFVQQLSDICSENNKPMEWLTGTGFRVVHRYPEYVPVISASTLYNKKGRLEVSFGTPTGELDPGAAKTGVAPNYIHSHDAAHMRLTILSMVEQGINQFSMIHDSFGCPAPQVPLMRKAINEQFVWLHEDCWLVQTKQNVAHLLGWEFEDGRLPAIPEYVDDDTEWFDIAWVFESEYIFG